MAFKKPVIYNRDKYKIKTEQKYYKVRIFCPNCAKWTSLDVPMGTRLILFLKNNTCENCGCIFIKTMKDYRELQFVGAV
jgi:ribosomal protein S27AE